MNLKTWQVKQKKGAHIDFLRDSINAIIAQKLLNPATSVFYGLLTLNNINIMPVSRLIFFPEDSNTTIDTSVLMDMLSTIQLIEKNSYQKNHYLAGEKFLSLITFLGCSPNINLLPVDNDTHCFISILPQTEQAICLGYTSTVKPKCPSCKKRITHWKSENWTEPGSICTCDKCQTRTPYAQLNWKQECGFARSGFEINHIYPHEAVPTDQLLLALQMSTTYKWNYCYANNPVIP